eukprot:3279775-Rhodomonas_salina.1
MASSSLSPLSPSSSRPFRAVPPPSSLLILDAPPALRMNHRCPPSFSSLPPPIISSLPPSEGFPFSLPPSLPPSLS